MMQVIECKKQSKLTKEILATVRTGRATPAMLDRVMVNYYGSPTPINQMAGVSVVEGRQLVIKPYDKSALKISNMEFMKLI